MQHRARHRPALLASLALDALRQENSLALASVRQYTRSLLAEESNSEALERLEVVEAVAAWARLNPVEPLHTRLLEHLARPLLADLHR